MQPFDLFTLVVDLNTKKCRLVRKKVYRVFLSVFEPMLLLIVVVIACIRCFCINNDKK